MVQKTKVAKLTEGEGTKLGRISRNNGAILRIPVQEGQGTQ